MTICAHCKVAFAPKRKEQRYCGKSCAAHYKGIAKRGKRLAPRIGWRYSQRTQDKDGYVRVFSVNHPHANGRKMIALHVMVMEQHIGRQIAASECVHHVNGNKLDNDLSNLMLMTRSSHSKHHAPETMAKRTRTERGRFA
jgi:hypothetical protein